MCVCVYKHAYMSKCYCSKQVGTTIKKACKSMECIERVLMCSDLCAGCVYVTASVFGMYMISTTYTRDLLFRDEVYW